MDIASLGTGGLALIAGIVVLLFAKPGAKDMKKVAWVLIAVGVLGGGLALVGINFSPLALGGIAGGVAQTGTVQAPALACPDDGTTSVTPNYINVLNTSASDTIDATMVFTSRESGHVVVITDTTNPSSTDFICGETYDGHAISTTTINGRLRGFNTPQPPGSSIQDGFVTIRPTSSNYAFTTQGARFQVPNARAYDNDAATFANDSTGTTLGAYRAAPNTFASTTAAWVVGAGGTLNLRIDVRSSIDAADVNDFGTWLLFDQAPSIWDVPVVKINGATAANQCSARNADEASSTIGSAADYCYLVPAGTPIQNVDKLVVDYSVKALSGVNPGATDDINMTIVPRGAYRSTANNNVVKVGGYKDDSSRTVTVGNYQWLIDVS